MKQVYILIILSLTTSTHTFAQKVWLIKDTIMSGSSACVLLQKTGNMRYNVLALDRSRLIELHNSRIELNGKPSYVITFSDRRQAIVSQQKPFPLSFVSDIVKHKIIDKGTVDTNAETRYVAAHPLPDGYTDVDQIINY